MSLYELDGLYHTIETEDWVKAHEILRTKNCRQKIEYVGNPSLKENTLHLACRKILTIPRNVLESMVSISSDSLLSQSSEGRTPLHHALVEIGLLRMNQLGENILHDTLLLLIDSCPGAVTLADNLGETPLHFAIDFDLSSDIFKRLLAAGPSAIARRNVRGNTPLVTFFEYWNIGIRRAVLSCERKGGLLQNSPVRHFYNMTDRLLHEVYDSVMQLIFAGNDEKYSKTCFSAARFALANVQCPWSIFHIILNAQPTIGFEHDGKGDYLLHLATTSQSTLDGDLYECTICGKQLSLVNHWGIDKADWFRYCRKCAHQSEDEDQDVDVDDDSFVYMDSIDKIPAIAKDLIKLNPEVANIPNHNGRLPLNLAIEQNSSLFEGHIKMIFEAAPESLNTRDVTNHMYPFMLAAVESTRDMAGRCDISESERMIEKFELCYELLIQNPTLVARDTTDE